MGHHLVAPDPSSLAPGEGGSAGADRFVAACATRASAGPERQDTIFQRLDETANFPYSMWEYVRRFAWAFVQRAFIRPSPPRANRWRRFWLRLFGAKVTPTSFIRASTTIRHPWLLELGQHCTLADDVVVYNLGPIKVGDHSVVSQGTYLCAGTHDYTKPNLPLLRPPIEIGRGVWVCAQAFIGPGVEIGDNSMVGARAVVMRSVPAGVIVAGNPARVVKARPMSAGPECQA